MSNMINEDGTEEDYFWLDYLPFGVLDHIASFLHGDDSLSFGQACSTGIMSSERSFWRVLRKKTTVERLVEISAPRKAGFYLEDPDYFIQIDSGRKYARFVYTCFEANNVFSLAKFCNTDSWKTFNRLYSYSSHVLTYDIPVFVFFDYPFIHEYRDLNQTELQVLRVARTGIYEKEPIIVSSLVEFKKNLNTRFQFSSFETWIDFSLFMLAGGAVLNCLLINDFGSSTQDLDFFWLQGTWRMFVEAIKRFEVLAGGHIIEKIHNNERIYDFILSFESAVNVKVQFIFGREKSGICFLLHTFDLDIVQVAFNGGKVVSTIAFCQAIATRSFISYKFTHDIHDTPYYVDRCLKYHARGFTLLCPKEFNDSFIQKPLVCEKKEVDYGFNDFYFNVDAFDMQSRFINLKNF